MPSSLAHLCLGREGSIRFVEMPDRRQLSDRRTTQRGGRRKGDLAATDRGAVSVTHAVVPVALAHA